MVKKLDACGLACPAPVLLVKDTVEQENPTTLTVLVDNDAARENVTRFLGSRDFMVTDSRQGDKYILEARRKGGVAPAKPAESPQQTARDTSTQKILVLAASDRLGTGDEVLGEKLMINYLKTIKEMGKDLWQLVFINSGVKLTTDTSPVLTELQDYEKSGVIILACGTCLEHFGLTTAKKVGDTTNMLDIVTATQLADKVISIG